MTVGTVVALCLGICICSSKWFEREREKKTKYESGFEMYANASFIHCLIFYYLSLEHFPHCILEQIPLLHSEIKLRKKKYERGRRVFKRYTSKHTWELSMTGVCVYLGLWVLFVIFVGMW